MKEEWRSVEGFQNYEVSNLGNVRSIDHYDKIGRFHKGKVLKACLDGRGQYWHVQLRKDGKSTSRNVHRLVAIAFVDNPDMLPEVNHIDENKANNAASNLEWCTHTYNNNYGSKKGATRGEKNPRNKFTAETIAFIKKNHVLCGGTMRNKEIAEMFGISKTHVCAIAHGRRWNHGASG